MSTRTLKRGLHARTAPILLFSLCSACASEREIASPPVAMPLDANAQVLDSVPSTASAACTPGGPACGGMFVYVGQQVVNPWITLTALDLGAYSRTWSDAGLIGTMTVTGGGTVKRRGATTQSFSLACSGTGTECHKDFKTYHTCDIERNDISASTVHTAVFANSIWTGNIVQNRSCLAPPTARMEMSYAGQRGSSLTVSLPLGSSATVALSASASRSADGSNLTYSWVSNASSLGSGVTSQMTAGGGTTVTLTVSEADGTTSATTGTFSVVAPVCAGVTPITGGCEDGQGGQVVISGAGGSEAPGEMHGGNLGSRWVCDTIWWYEWSGYDWRLVDIQVLTCWVE